jgi:hypothetical protein
MISSSNVPAFGRAPIRFASDPLNFSSYADFTFPRAPRVSLLPDTPGTSLVQLSDKTFRSDDLGPDLRNLDLVLGGGEYLEASDLEAWRIFRKKKQFFSFFPNYDASTLGLSHFEDNLLREITARGGDPTIIGGSTYVAGALGSGIYLNATSKLGYPFLDASFPATGSVNFWTKFPADGSWYSLNGLTVFGVNVFCGWSHWAGPPGQLLWRPAMSSEVNLTPGQLPTILANQWFNIGWSWRSGASRHAVLVINGINVAERDLDNDPTFYNGMTFGYSFVSGDEYYRGPFDEIRIQDGYRDVSWHGGCFERRAEVTARILAGQTQGAYFAILSDDLGFITKPQTDRIVGRLRLQSAYVNESHLLARISDSLIEEA